MGQRKVRLGRVSDTDIRLFRLFKAIVDAKGLGPAVVELGISRSTISTHLSELETRLGMRLGERRRGGFRLTEAGSAVYSAVCSLMNSLDHFQNEINTLESDLKGELTVALSDNNIWHSSLKLVESISKFLSGAPQVRLNLLILSPNEMEARIIDGDVDIGISPIIRKIPTLQYEERIVENSFVYCGRNHPLFSVPDEEINISDIIDSDIVHSDYIFNDEMIKPIDKGYIKSNHLEASAILILSGRYLSFLTDYYAEHWVSRGEMRKFKPDKLFSTMKSGIIVKKGRPVTQMQIEFINCLNF